MLKKLLGKYYGNPWLHFAVCVLLPFMVLYYFVREIRPIGPKLDALQDKRGKPHFEGWDRKRRIFKLLIKKADFHLAVLGAVVGTIIWNAIF